MSCAGLMSELLSGGQSLTAQSSRKIAELANEAVSQVRRLPWTFSPCHPQFEGCVAESVCAWHSSSNKCILTTSSFPGRSRREVPPVQPALPLRGT